MTLAHDAAAHAARYGWHDVKHTIKEITLREQMPAYGQNRKELTNARRRIKRQLTKCGFEQVDALLRELGA